MELVFLSLLLFLSLRLSCSHESKTNYLARFVVSKDCSVSEEKCNENAETISVYIDRERRMAKLVNENPAGDELEYDRDYKEQLGHSIEFNPKKHLKLLSNIDLDYLEMKWQNLSDLGSYGSTTDDPYFAQMEEVSLSMRNVNKWYRQRIMFGGYERSISIMVSRVQNESPSRSLRTPTIVHMIDFQKTIRIVELRNITTDLNHEDPFKLRRGLAISTQEDTSRSEFTFWFNKLATRAVSMSYSVFEDSGGFRVEIDTRANYITVDHIGQSQSRIDMDRKVLFYKKNHLKPTYQRQSGNPTGDLHQVRNAECSLIRLPPDLSLKYSDSPIELWKNLLGEPNSMQYLGRTRFDDARLAHEFELTYGETSFPFLLIHKFNWRKRIVLQSLRLFIAVTNTCKGNFDQERCSNPEIIGLKLSDGTMLKIHDFRWDDWRSAAVNSLDFSDCPSKLWNLHVSVKWTGVASSDSCRDGSEIDEHVQHLISRSISQERLSIHNIERHEISTLGNDQGLTYRVRLLGKVKSAFEFQRISLPNGNPDENYLLMNRSNHVTQLECFGLASNFDYPEILVAYSASKMGCLIYRSTDCSKSLKETDEYDRFERVIKSEPEDVNDESLESRINSNIVNIRESEFCLDEGIKISQLSSIGIKLERENRLSDIHNRDFEKVDIAGRTYKVTYKTKNFKSRSKVDCAQKCQASLGCSSFSYCHDGSNLCILSQRQLNYTKQNTFNPDEVDLRQDCLISAKDFMRYFNVPRTRADQINFEVGDWSIGEAESDQICAASCLKSNDCDKLVVCPKPQEAKIICAHKLRPNKMDSARQASHLAEVDLKSCKLYDRDPISFFEKTDDNSTQWTSLDISSVSLRQINIDKCAIACQRDPNCRSIDFCRLDQKDGQRKSPELKHDCVLVRGSIKNISADQRKANLHKDASRSCSHYELNMRTGERTGDSGVDELAPVNLLTALTMVILGITIGVEVYKSRAAKRERGNVSRDHEEMVESCADCCELVS